MPDQFPVFQGYVAGTTLTGTSPLVDELAANAAMGELAWQDENLINEFRDQGIEPLNLFNAAGAVLPMCAEETITADDWNGKQVRASSSAHTQQLEALNASPVSMAYTETFEALQRNTVNCTLTATLAADAGGFMEVAPHASYTSDVAFARGPGGVYAGIPAIREGGLPCASYCGSGGEVAGCGVGRRRTAAQMMGSPTRLGSTQKDQSGRYCQSGRCGPLST